MQQQSVSINDERRIILIELGIEDGNQPTIESNLEDLLWIRCSSLSNCEAENLAHRVANQIFSDSADGNFDSIYGQVLAFIKGYSSNSGMGREFEYFASLNPSQCD